MGERAGCGAAMAQRLSQRTLGDAPGAVLEKPCIGRERAGLQGGPHRSQCRPVGLWLALGIAQPPQHAAGKVVVFFQEFLIKGEWRRTNPGAEMGAPYGRIIVLHFAIFAGAGALFLLGQPMVGVLALNWEASDLGALISAEARSVRREVQRAEIEIIEKRAQQVWIPVTVATLLPGVIFMAVPFIDAMGKLTGR